MNKVNIDLDEKLVNYIKEKCNKDITSDIEIIIQTALSKKKIENQNVSISISAVDKEKIHDINK